MHFVDLTGLNLSPNRTTPKTRGRFLSVLHCRSRACGRKPVCRKDGRLRALPGGWRTEDRRLRTENGFEAGVCSARRSVECLIGWVSKVWKSDVVISLDGIRLEGRR